MSRAGTRGAAVGSVFEPFKKQHVLSANIGYDYETREPDMQASAGPKKRKRQRWFGHGADDRPPCPGRPSASGKVAWHWALIREIRPRQMPERELDLAD